LFFCFLNIPWGYVVTVMGVKKNGDCLRWPFFFNI